MSFVITASIVVYNNDLKQLEEAISSFLDSSLKLHLYVVDHSPTTWARSLCNDHRVTYIHTGENMGFGAGHNIIMKDHDKLGAYHLVLNPDIKINKHTLSTLVGYLDKNKDVACAMPQILNSDNTEQLLPKCYPNPLNLFVRFFPALKKLAAGFDRRYVLADISKEKPYQVGIVSGCFMLIRSEVFKKEVFDERFFMYFEDFDLSRRINRSWRLMLVPEVSVYHNYERGAHKQFFLFKTMLISMFKYFNKYAWFFDGERKRVNRKLQNQ